MGQVIDNIHQVGFKSQLSKEAPILLDHFALVHTLQNGNAVVKTQNNLYRYIYHKQFQQTSKNDEIIEKWLKNNYNHSCNILNYEIKSKSLLCGSHIAFKILLQYGQTSLSHILNHQNSYVEQKSKDSYEINEGYKFDTPLELLQFIKMMIDVVEQQRQKNKIWISFHTKNIIYFHQLKIYKYFYLLNFDQNSHHQEFFAPQTTSGAEITQKDTVFSMGMILLSLFLKQDCSDCYNYHNHIFCQSIFEDKIEKMKQKMITKGLLGILDDESQYVTQFDEQLSEFILLMTEKEPQRLTFAEVKKRYLWLIKKASFSFGVNNQTSFRSIIAPLTSKRVDHSKRKMQANIGCFSIKENIHFKTTFTQIDDSQFFTISRSNIQNNNNEKKLKYNQALKWKKAITSKMKEQKQNFPFYQQI